MEQTKSFLDAGRGIKLSSLTEEEKAPEENKKHLESRIPKAKTLFFQTVFENSPHLIRSNFRHAWIPNSTSVCFLMRLKCAVLMKGNEEERSHWSCFQVMSVTYLLLMVLPHLVRISAEIDRLNVLLQYDILVCFGVTSESVQGLLLALTQGSLFSRTICSARDWTWFSWM